MNFQAKPSLRSVTVVIVTYNSEHVIKACLNAIPASANCIVVDNNSRDGTLKAVEGVRPEAGRLAMGRNLGFGSACNVGLRLVDTPYALLVNPDLYLDGGTIEACLHAGENNPKIALFGLNNNELALDDGGLKGQSIVDVKEITGEFMFMRMSAFSKIGFFDENIFMYFEDNDLCLRTRLAGYGIARVMSATATHQKSRSTSPRYNSIYERARIWGQSCAYFGEKYAEYPEGQRALRKSSRYRMKAISKAIVMNHVSARIYQSRFRGMAEYRKLGTAIMHDNMFTADDTPQG